MTTFLISLLPVSLGIWCIHILFEEDQIFEKAGDWMEKNWPVWINKPLWGCPICMSSIWGTIGFFAIDFLFGIHHDLKLWIPFVFCQCGLNVLLNGVSSRNRIIKDIDDQAYLKIINLIDAQKNNESKKS
jgi:hypothetical protein